MSSRSSLKRQGSSLSGSRSRKRVATSAERKQAEKKEAERKQLSAERKSTAAADRREAELRRLSAERQRSQERKQAVLAERGRIRAIEANLRLPESHRRLSKLEQTLREIFRTRDLPGLGREFALPDEEDDEREIAFAKFRRQKGRCERNYQYCIWTTSVTRSLPYTLVESDLPDFKIYPDFKIGTPVILLNWPHANVLTFFTPNLTVYDSKLTDFYKYLAPLSNFTENRAAIKAYFLLHGIEPHRWLDSDRYSSKSTRRNIYL